MFGNYNMAFQVCLTHYNVCKDDIYIYRFNVICSTTIKRSVTLALTQPGSSTLGHWKWQHWQHSWTARAVANHTTTWRRPLWHIWTIVNWHNSPPEQLSSASNACALSDSTAKQQSNWSEWQVKILIYDQHCCWNKLLIVFCYLNQSHCIASTHSTSFWPVIGTQSPVNVGTRFVATNRRIKCLRIVAGPLPKIISSTL